MCVLEEETGCLREMRTRSAKKASASAGRLRHRDLVAESGRGSGRAELRALALGGAVRDAFRENANCGDPVE